MTPILSILILNYNTKELTLACLDSIRKHYKKQIKDGEFEILIGDNASSDTSVPEILNFKSKIPNLTLIENKENFGFAKGQNILSRNAKGKYLLFLNSDTEFEDENLLKTIEFLEKNNKVGILGIKMKNSDGSLQLSSGVFFTLLNTILTIIGGERIGLTRFSPKEITEVDWVSGGAMIIKKDLFQKLNGFDENFFMYVEDMELCFRSKKLGFLTYFYPYTSVIHKELASSNRSYAILSIYKGVSYFFKKHKSYFEYLLIKYLFKLKAVLALTIGIISKNSYFSNAYKKILMSNI